MLIGDSWLWRDGQSIAGQFVETEWVSSLAEVRNRPRQAVPAWLAVDTVHADRVRRGLPEAACGASVLQVLNPCLRADRLGEADAICFAPLNKYVLKLGGMNHEGEVHYFADLLGATGYLCKLNTPATCGRRACPRVFLWETRPRGPACSASLMPPG